MPSPKRKKEKFISGTVWACQLGLSAAAMLALTGMIHHKSKLSKPEPFAPPSREQPAPNPLLSVDGPMTLEKIMKSLLPQEALGPAWEDIHKYEKGLKTLEQTFGLEGRDLVFFANGSSDRDDGIPNAIARCKLKKKPTILVSGESFSGKSSIIKALIPDARVTIDRAHGSRAAESIAKIESDDFPFVFLDFDALDERSSFIPSSAKEMAKSGEIDLVWHVMNASSSILTDDDFMRTGELAPVPVVMVASKTDHVPESKKMEMMYRTFLAKKRFAPNVKELVFVSTEEPAKDSKRGHCESANVRKRTRDETLVCQEHRQTTNISTRPRGLDNLIKKSCEFLQK